MNTYRLLSTPMVHTPGIVAWAINAYRFPDDGDRANIRKVMESYPGLPAEIIEGLLTKAIPYTVNGDTVTIQHAVHPRPKYKGVGRPGRCTCCGRKLNPNVCIMLELDSRVNEYHDWGGVPDEHNQGSFEFGTNCAIKARMRAKALLETL